MIIYMDYTMKVLKKKNRGVPSYLLKPGTSEIFPYEQIGTIDCHYYKFNV